MSFLRKIFGIYGLVVVTLIVIVIVPIYVTVFMISRQRETADRRGHNITRAASRVLFFFYGIRLKVTNEHILHNHKVCIFVANHSSLLDVPAVTLATAHTFKFLAKAELTKIPLFGYIIRNLYLTVKRGNRDDRARSMETMIACLNQGISIFIFPEGTRNKTNEPLGDFYDGAFRLSLETMTPIAIAAIIGSRNLLNNTELKSGTMSIDWQDVVVPTVSDDVNTLKNKTRDLLYRRLSQL